jgi:glycosyltransferase involved in cell wall biosynthesis
VTEPPRAVRAEDISVIMPVGRHAPAAERAISAVLECSPPPGEFIVVADGLPVEARGSLSRNGVTVLATDDRQGPGLARNVGAAHARGSVLLFLDADVEAPADLVGRVAAILTGAPDAAAVIGSYDDKPTAPGIVSQYRNLLHHFVHQHSNEVAATFWGACGAIRRGAFVAVGGFAPHYRRPCIEDIELGHALVRAGYRITLRKDLQVRHLKRWTAWSVFHADLWDRALPWSLLILRSGVWPRDLNLRREHQVSVALTMLALGSAITAIWFRPMLALLACCLVGILIANARFYAFLARSRGRAFALAAMPWHWMHYLAAGLGFIAAWVWVLLADDVLHLQNKTRRPPA